MLVRVVEECPDLMLRNEVDGVKRGRSRMSGFVKGDTSLDFIP